jgi:serine protease
MKSVLALVFCVSLAAAWAPLHKMEKPIEGSYLVVFNDNAPNMATIEEVESWLAANFNGISQVVKSVWLINPEGEIRFRGFAAQLTMEQVQVLQHSKAIAYIEEDSEVKVDPIFENDTRAQAQDDAVDWGINRVDQRCLPLNGVANPCGGKSNDCAGSNTVVWVVDTGVRTTHTEFAGRASLRANFAAGDASPYNGDCNGHGTHCAGSVAGKTYGVAKSALIYGVRVLNCQGSGTNQNVIDGFNYVGNNMVSGKRNILSASLGGGLSTATNNAIDATANKGVTCVVAAGNDNANACNYSPASASLAITVGATDKTDTRSSFSNFGSCVNVFAPGSSITSAWYTSDTATNTISGTSMATPITAGSIAVLPTTTASSYSAINSQITSFATRGVVKTAGTGSPNYLVYDRWNDGTALTC